jgi:hypothetical protein
MEHALPRRTAGNPRSWSLLLTSENHGAVGPLGSTFPHAGEKHERVQVVEIVAAGSAPAPGVDLAGLVRFGFCDINDDEFLERPDGAYFLAHEVEARCASAAPVAAQAGQVAVPDEQLEWSHDLQERLIAASQDFAEHESVRQVMAEAACLLAALTGVQASISGERQEGNGRG